MYINRAFYGRIFYLNVPTLSNLAWNAILVEVFGMNLRIRSESEGVRVRGTIRSKGSEGSRGVRESVYLHYYPLDIIFKLAHWNRRYALNVFTPLVRKYYFLSMLSSLLFFPSFIHLLSFSCLL